MVFESELYTGHIFVPCRPALLGPALLQGRAKKNFSPCPANQGRAGQGALQGKTFSKKFSKITFLRILFSTKRTEVHTGHVLCTGLSCRAENSPKNSWKILENYIFDNLICQIPYRAAHRATSCALPCPAALSCSALPCYRAGQKIFFRPALPNRAGQGNRATGQPCPVRISGMNPRNFSAIGSLVQKSIFWKKNTL